MNAASCSEKRIQSNVFWIVPYSGLLHAVIMAVKDTFHIFPINIFRRATKARPFVSSSENVNGLKRNILANITFIDIMFTTYIS